MRIVITGAAGMLGSMLVYEWRGRHNILALTRNQALHPKGFETSYCPLDDEEDFFKTVWNFKPDWLVHCAALTDHGKCEWDHRLAEDTNIHLAANAARIGKRLGIGLLHISTDGVFWGPKDGKMYNEEDIPAPRNYYGITKQKAEEAIQDIYDKAAVVRTTFYGWNGGKTQKKSLAVSVLDALEKGETYHGWKNVYFNPLFTGDLAYYLLCLMNTNPHGVYHIAGESIVSKYEFAKAVADVWCYADARIEPVEYAGADRPLSPILDSTKFKKETHLSAPTVREGLIHMFDWADKNLVEYMSMFQ